MKNKNYETPIVAVSQLETADIVRTSTQTESSAEFEVGGFFA